MKQVNIHKLWEKHTFPVIKSLYKVHFACDHLFPMPALGLGFGSMFCGSPGTSGPEEGRHEAIVELWATGCPLSSQVWEWTALLHWEWASLPGMVK